MALQTWVARFVVENSRVTEEGGRLRSFQRRRLDEPDVDLHLLAEPAGVKGDDLGAQALDAIGRIFLADRLSVTGGLLRALRSTHQTLLDWNRRSIPREQVAIGVTGVILSGSVLYLLQTGPTLVYMQRNGVLRRLEPLQQAGHAPLGDGDVEPLIRRIDLQPGDLLVASSVALQSILKPDALNDVLNRGSEEALPELYLMTRDLPAFALMAVTCFEGEEEPEPEPLIEETLPAPVAPATRDARIELSAPGHTLEREPPLSVAVAPPPLDISRPIVRLRTEKGGSRSDYVRTTGPGRRFNLNIMEPRYAIMAAAAVLVLFVGAFAVPDLIRENRTERLNTLIVQAELQLTTGLAQTDPALKRRQLEDARRLSAEAIRLDEANPAALSLQQQASAVLEQINAVFDLSPMTSITTLGRQITGEVSIDSVTLAGGIAYLLDAKGGRIIAVPLSGATPPAIVFQQGETYGGTQAKVPQYVTWEGTPQSGRLLVLDAERKLYELRPGSTPGPLPLRRTNTWSSVAGIAAYDGNLYILDPAGHQVHRYLTAAAGFDSEPSPALSGQQRLGDAVDFAVDGDIFIVQKSGQVHRFRNGADLGFSLGGIDRELETPTGITAVTGSDDVYVADSGNKRIVVAGRDGIFRRQFVSNAFTDVRAMAVDPASAQLYVVVGDALLTAPLVR